MHQKIQLDGQAGQCRLAGNSEGHRENSIFSSPTLFYMCKEWNIKKWGMSSSTAIPCRIGLNNQVEWNGNLQWMHNALLNVSQHPEVAWFWKISWHFQVRWLGSKQNVRRFSDPYPIVCFESTQRTSKHHLTSQNHPTPGFRIEKI